MNRCEAIFLDRDGVINHDFPADIKSWAGFHRGMVPLRTGNGPAAERALAAADIRPDAVVADLSAAAHLLLADFQRPDSA